MLSGKSSGSATLSLFEKVAILVEQARLSGSCTLCERLLLCSVVGHCQENQICPVAVGWAGVALIANTQTQETDLSFEQKIAEHTLSGEEFYSVDEMGLFRQDLLDSFL